MTSNSVEQVGSGPMTSPSMARRHDLDALRAVAMLLGIGLHAALSFVAFPWVVQDTQQDDLFGLFFLAIHGFRMPVFFVMSGFFTAMLWRRRGLAALVSHRFRRVLLPCLLGLITIVPAVNWVSGLAIKDAASAKTERTTGDAPSPQDSIWAAAAFGDVGALLIHLEAGADLNAFDPVFGVTPLAWATMHRQASAVEYLLLRGADVNARNRDGTTPLHGAAFVGASELATELVAAGADINAQNLEGATPLDTTSLDWGTTQWVAELIGFVLTKGDVEAGRTEMRELLTDSSKDSAAAPSGDEPARIDTERRGLADLIIELRFKPIFATSIFHHLWFLWFLCWLVVGFSIYAALADAKQWKAPPSWFMLSPLRYAWLIPLTKFPQWYMGLVFPSFGPDTSTGLLPMPHVLLYYAIFFGFGAIYYDCDDVRGRVGRFWWLTLPFALFVVLPLGLAFSFGSDDFGSRIDEPLHRPIAVALQVAYAWLMTFGLMGLFRKILSRERRAMRYLSDSSYWLYLAHVPLVIGAQWIVRDWDLPAIVKFALVCTSISALLLFTYQTMVRYTPLGTLLNGPRTRQQRISSTQP